MPRLFIGIKIENQPQIEVLSSELRNKFILSDINWVPQKNFHLTLKFLGDVETHLISPMCDLIVHIGSKHKPFNLRYNKIGYFGSLMNPKVIWFDFKPNQELNILQSAVDKSMTELGFDIEINKYTPHLTLARIKKINEVDSFNDLFINQPVYEELLYVREFQLFQSNLRKEGPEYNIISSFKLGTAN